MPRKPASPHAEKTGCPIAFGVDLFGDRWTLLVLRDLLVFRKRHYGEFLASDEGIATNVLADRLQRLEAVGVVERRKDPRQRNRVIYRPTQKGKDLVPVLLEIVRWSGKHDPGTAAPAEFLERLERDRDGMVQELLAAMDAEAADDC